MLIELRLELMKLLRKPRTYLGPAGMVLLIALGLVAMKFGNEFQYMYERLARDFIISGSFVNAAFLARFMLLEFVVFMFLPLSACLVFGDLIASEAADGTLRALLCRPVTRTSVAVSKYIVGALYVFALTLGTGVAAYLVGTTFLSRGSLLTFYEGIWILPERTAIVRLALTYGLVAFGMLAVGSMAFAISTFLSNSNGAVAGAMGVVIISGIVEQIEYFARLRPYLLTPYLEVERYFTGTLDLHMLIKSVLVMLAYSAVGLIVGLAIFRRRDVLS